MFLCARAATPATWWPSDLDGPVEAITSDVSFISQLLALPPALALSAPGAFAVILAKPQFEVRTRGLGKDGVVRDEAMRRRPPLPWPTGWLPMPTAIRN